MVSRHIVPKKGPANDPNNYRGITILSCFGKLFTSILNERLTDFIESNNVLGQEQAGFREGYSTTDHIFTLYSVINIFLCKKRRLFCAFIDYKKAFDKVKRSFLWDKMLTNCNINGKILNVVKNIYMKA